MNLRGLLEAILQKKRDAEAHGWILDVVVMPEKYSDALLKAVTTQTWAGDAYTLGSKEDGYPIHLHGVKVMWSASRLPFGQVWYRYRGQGEKTPITQRTAR